ncbi:uncharacterized protein TNCV_2351621 [Trichonephila clavipes]|nr:uncharacterized protein TNCV_2351621 [Trichonephila clavipes]
MTVSRIWPVRWVQDGNVAAVAEWYRHRIVAGFVTSSSPVPLKTRRVGQRCTLNLSKAETSSRWCGVVVRRGGCQLRCRPRHLTMVQNYVVRRQKQLNSATLIFTHSLRTVIRNAMLDLNSPPIASIGEDRHVAHIVLMNRAATARALSPELGSFARQRHRHTGPLPGGAIGYTSRSPLVRIARTLNRALYISGVLRPVALPFIRALRNLTFQQDNARPHVAGLDTENVQLLSWPARSPDLSPIETVWSMVFDRLARHHTPLTTVDELWHR